MSLTHVDPHVSEIVMVWIQSGDLLMVWIQISLYINAIPATILFDSGATHSFMSARYANTNELPLRNMKTPMIVITPKGPVKANHMTHKLTLTIMGREFWATPIVLEESSIDLILGMSWLRKAKAIIQCGRGTVELTSPKGKRFEVEIAVTTTTRLEAFLLDGSLLVTTFVWLGIFRTSFQRSYQGCHQIGKLSFSLISYLGLLLFLNSHIGCL
jgi:hypothetical protein